MGEKLMIEYAPAILAAFDQNLYMSLADAYREILLADGLLDDDMENLQSLVDEMLK